MYKSVGLIFAAACATAGTAQANIMTFSFLPVGVVTQPTYVENGITATGPGDFVNAPNGSLHIDPCCIVVPTTNYSYDFTLASGPFKLVSFDISATCSTTCAPPFGELKAFDIANNQIFFDKQLSHNLAPDIVFPRMERNYDVTHHGAASF